MSVRSALNGSGKGALWSVPLLADKFGSNIKGIYFYPDQIIITYAGQGKVICNAKESFVANEFLSGAFIGVDRDNISLGSWAEHQHCWFNYFEPKNAYPPIAYDFGNGTNGGYAELYAAKYNVASSPSVKENIKEISDVNALEKINGLKFYSYDYKNEPKQKLAKNAEPLSEKEKLIAQKKAELPPIRIHEEMGVMTTEAPKEILAENGKAIDLYAYIGLTAKAVQELAEKVEQQAQEIAQLKAEISKLEQ